ncbi:unnamed protein product [Soboliphyme baturini]|uniref:Transposase n=1 Tax=Soboliphyme baturini TaxID=241478 RepID=A0A183IXQ7_9BILA|nr:unnamed protein product [Soboliphyme baturini]
MTAFGGVAGGPPNITANLRRYHCKLCTAVSTIANYTAAAQHLCGLYNAGAVGRRIVTAQQKVSSFR